MQRRQRNVQKSVMHVQSCCFANLRASLHVGGGPQIGEVTCHPTCHVHVIKLNYMDRRVTPPKRVTSPTWGPPLPCKQALKLLLFSRSRCRRRRHCLGFLFTDVSSLTASTYSRHKVIVNAVDKLHQLKSENKHFV